MNRMTPIRAESSRAVLHKGVADESREELRSLNDELAHRVEDLTRANGDLRNRLESTQVLLRELQHRVRNILAVVRSLAQRTGNASDSVEAYSRMLEGRINAMARTHSMLTSAPEASVDLHSLIKSELQAPGGDRSDNKLSISGPRVMLSGKAAGSLTMAVHELATNAVKYGALSVLNGHVYVSWEIKDDRDPRMLLTWRETNVKVSPPSRRGFGSELLEKVVPYDFGGTGRMEFKPGGLTCVLDLPLSREMRVINALKTGTGLR